MRSGFKSGSKRFRIAVVVAVMVAVLTVLIAPSIDMPETVLREHHVAAHTMVNGNSGTLTVVGIISVADAIDGHAVLLNDGSRNPEHGHSQTSLVLRC
ncbi:hypothetical protein [Occallatibacter savannae]|uniref:hypothetical protein n=1 Tax=Occallatibacter savannae TaxID=1002691 RepID=UPI00195236DF|nr:hypothetical protein [Occallatibacter savannae]